MTEKLVNSSNFLTFQFISISTLADALLSSDALNHGVNVSNLVATPEAFENLFRSLLQVCTLSEYFDEDKTHSA